MPSISPSSEPSTQPTGLPTSEPTLSPTTKPTPVPTSGCPKGTYHKLLTNNEQECIVCPAGRYVDYLGAKQCTKCPPARYNNVSGGYVYNASMSSTIIRHDDVSDCTRCPAGSYTTNATNGSVAQLSGYGVPFGATACIICPAGTYQNSTMSYCSNCVAGSYLPDDQKLTQNHDSVDDCRVCEAGYFSTIPRAASCNGNCSAGKYNNATDASGHDNATDCITCPSITPYSPGATGRCYKECPKGMYILAGVTGGCAECLRGSYTDTVGQSSCSVCGKGTYSTTVGSSSCTTCAGGTYLSDTGTRTAHDEASDCTTCPDGKYSYSDRSDCEFCDAGTAATSDGCETCAKGTYGVDGEACDTCQSGYYTNGWSNRTYTKDDGSEVSYGEGAYECLSCAAGKFSISGHNLNCTSCTPGKYSTAGSEECSECKKGEYASEKEKANSCDACPQGYYAPNTSMTACEPCPPGKSQSASQQSVCEQCEAGKYNENYSATSCVACTAGTHSPSTGATSCISCDQGKYSSVEQSTTCFECEEGKYATFDTSASCESCKPGYAQNMTGQQSCDRCPLGKYAQVSASRDCLACFAGRFAHRTASENCSDCLAGTFSLEGATACTVCPNGYFSSASVATKCEVCEAGRYMAFDRTNCISCRDLENGLWSDEASTSCKFCSPGYYRTLRKCDYPFITDADDSSANENDESSDTYEWTANYSLFSEKPAFSILDCRCEHCESVEMERDAFDCSIAASTSSSPNEDPIYPQSSGGEAIGPRNISSLFINDGYWRYPSTSVWVHACANIKPRPCVKGFFSNERIKVHNDHVFQSRGHCAPGYGGPLCRVCEIYPNQYWYDSMSKTCNLCKDASNFRDSVFSAIFMILLFILAAYLALKLYIKYKNGEHSDWAILIRRLTDGCYLVIERCK